MNQPLKPANIVSQPEKPGLSWEGFERLGKAFAVIAVMLYGTGLLVTNQYLSQFGITDFSSLRPKYILTGALTLALLCLGSLPTLLPALGARMDETRSRLKLPPRPGWFRFLRSALLVVVGMALGVFGLAALEQSGDSGFSGATLIIALYPFTWCALTLSRSLWQGRDEWRHPYFVMQVSLLCFLFLVLLTAIGAIVYDQVPESLGGGRPVTADLLLSKDGSEFWARTGVNQAESGDSRRTVPVKIVYQGERELVVIAPYGARKDRERVVILARPLVDGILPAEDEVTHWNPPRIPSAERH